MSTRDRPDFPFPWRVRPKPVPIPVPAEVSAAPAWDSPPRGPQGSPIPLPPWGISLPGPCSVHLTLELPSHPDPPRLSDGSHRRQGKEVVGPGTRRSCKGHRKDFPRTYLGPTRLKTLFIKVDPRGSPWDGWKLVTVYPTSGPRTPAPKLPGLPPAPTRRPPPGAFKVFRPPLQPRPPSLPTSAARACDAPRLPVSSQRTPPSPGSAL